MPIDVHFNLMCMDFCSIPNDMFQTISTYFIFLYVCIYCLVCICMIMVVDFTSDTLNVVTYSRTKNTDILGLN